jgi:uncharacterized protein with beta-barrel porin domain
MNCKGVFQVLQRVILKSMTVEVMTKRHVSDDNFAVSIVKPFGKPTFRGGLTTPPLSVRVVRALIIGTIAVAFAAASARDVAAQTVNLSDVPVGGISYTSGVDTVNVGDGVPGETVVNSGTIGIELSRTGVNGADEGVTVTFQVISYDIDPDPDVTELRDIVSADGVTPLLSGGEFIFANGGPPDTSFTIGAVTYTGDALMEFLATSSVDPGGTITGSLTVNNNNGPAGAGAPFTTTNADGIRVNSTGGKGGNGRCHTILGLYTWCSSGDGGGSAGSVVVNSNSSITVNGTAEGKYGVTAVSQGGAGGNGGGSFGLFASKAGRGGNGGTSGTVFVTLGIDSNITTHGAKSHGVFAQSRGGDGGSGGAPSGLVALGTKGGNGGDAGNVTVYNQGSILTTGWNSHGIYARSVGAGAGSGSSSGGIYAEGGNGGGESSGAMVTVNNSGTITTQNSDSFGILAQSIGGGGGDGGGAGGLFTVGGRGGSGGGSDIVTVFDSGTVQTSGDRSTAIFAQSIGGGGGNGGDAISFSPLPVSVAVGGQGGLGGDGHNVLVTAEGSNIDTAGDEARGIQAQSVGGGGGNGGLAVSGTIPTGSSINASIALGGNGGGGGDAGDTVTVITSSSTDIDTMGINSQGISAQSIGGGGGNGGSSFSATGGGSISVAVAVGGKGGVAGNGKSVIINNAATITTSDELSTGILAQSIGGGGGNGGFAGTLAIGGGSASVGLGGGAGGGGASGLVDVTNSNTIQTGGENAVGILAQSIGGGGGNGGSALSGSGGLLAISTAIGGAGGSGNNGGEVKVDNFGDVTTTGGLSYGIFGQSVGGGGGNGGFALSGALAVSVENIPAGAAAISIGGAGGGTSSGGNVTIDINDGNIETEGLGAHAVFAQSIGGSGGNGGFAGSLAMTVGSGAAFGVAIGGSGANGGDAGEVHVTSAGNSITTHKNSADGIHAQSVGGGGGDGGFAFSGAAGFGGEKNLNVTVAVGGGGGVGGEGNIVDASNSATITTNGDHANGIFAQSIGGGGGNGGLAVSGTLGLSETSGNVGVTVGGGGGTGNIARDVTIANYGAISTFGMESYGILGQSIGGSGGNGGLALTAQLTGTTKQSATVGVSVGGGGGTGNSAGVVEITNDSGGVINTTGFGAHGIKGQSIGGGGGNGGMAIVGQVGVGFGSKEQATKTLNVGVTVGGAGGGGGFGNTVHVTNNDSIEVMGDTATGIIAQSIGGGGGDGGGALNAIGLLTDSTNDDSRTVNANVSVGGGGGDGNHGGAVTVDNTGSITTHGVSGYGVYAQSVGGGGGIGGRANTFSLVVTDACTVPGLCTAPASNKNNFQLGVTVGGNGGGASNGGVVTVNNTGAIETFGNTADGIYAQSVGGGGGAGGNGILGSGEILPVPAELAFIPVGAVSFYKNIQAVVGGSAGSSGNGGMVEVNNDKNITTHGSNSNGIFAQSVGGGGGVGGKAAIGATGTFGLGGAGGAAGNGGNVTVNQFGGATIETFGTASNGIFAQSVGGGGGVAGNVDRALAGVKVSTPPGLHPTNLGIGLAFGRSGGGGGDGGVVTVDVDGQIITHGDSAAGIFAQSIGGGGGVLGELGNDLLVLTLLSWQIGSAGDAGNASLVDVNLTGSIVTAGNSATGIFAQSAGGTGTAGALNVTLDGSILTGAVLQAGDEDRGLGSIGILAQSAAANNANNGDITIAINSPDAVVRGGRSQVIDADRTYTGVGIQVIDGKNNTITNRGHVTTLGGVNEGFAILATGSDATHPGGNETVDNYGTITGNVNLGAGSNAFNNMVGGTFNAGATVNLEGGTLSNSGMFSPGGSGIVLTTDLNGNLMQVGSGTYAVDLDFGSDMVDLLNVSGTKDLAGKAYINILNAGWSTPGTQQSTFLSGAGVVIDPGLSLDFQPSAVITYDLLYPNPTDVMLSTSVDFCPPSAGLNANQTAIGNAVNAIQLAGGSASFAPFAAALFRMPDIQSLASAYDQMSPDTYDIYTKITSVITQQYTQTLLKRIHSIRSPLRLAGSAPKHADRDQILLAYNGSDASIGQLSGTGELTPEKATYGVWLDGFGKSGDQDETDGFNGYQYNVYGATLGLDRTFGTRFVAGIGIGYSYTDVGLDGARGKGDIDTICGALYGSYFTRRMYVDAALSYGRQSYDIERNIVIGPLQNTASSDHSGDTYSAFAEGGYNVGIKNWIIQPFVSLHYIYLDEESFRESGAGGVSLRVESRQTDSLVSELGARITRVFRIKNSSLIPEISAAWNYDFDVDDRMITASFAGAPGTSFSVRGQDVEQHGATVGAGLTFISKGGLSASLKYNGEFRENYQAHGILAGLRYEF